MIKQAKKVLTLAALMLATGVATFELTRNPAQADPTVVLGPSANYSGSRVDEAFEVAPEIPQVTSISIPLAAKGDLMPIGCAEAVDCAAVVTSESAVVLETRTSDSSILVRMPGYTMAVLEDARHLSD